MRNSESKITAGIDLYFSNLSSRKVRNHFRRHWEANASHVTILDWCRRYTMKVTEYVESLKPQFGGRIYADETEIERGKNRDIFWCAVDWDTRFIIATHYSPNNQSIFDAKIFLGKIKNKNIPRYIQTDSAPFYPHAMRKIFGRGSRKPLTEHKITNVYRTGKHNVRI